MGRLNAAWDNFTKRGQAWDSFWGDGPSLVTHESSFTADASLLRPDNPGSFDVSACLRATVGGSLAVDAVVAATSTGSFAGDAVVRQTATGTLTAHAVILREQQGSLTTDAIVLRQGAGSLAVDALIGSSVTTVYGDFTADAFVEGWFSLDAWVLAGYSTVSTSTFNDPFTRTVAEGWGGSWETDPYYATFLSADGANALVNVDSSIPVGNPEVLGVVSSSTFTIGFDFYAPGWGEVTPYWNIVTVWAGDSYLSLWVDQDPVTASPYSVRVYVYGTPSTASYTIEEHEWYTVRLQQAGLRTRAKVWKRSDPEPSWGAPITRWYAYSQGFQLHARGGPTEPARIDNVFASSALTVDAVYDYLHGRGWFVVPAVKYRSDMPGSFTVDATWDWLHFHADAIIGTVVHPYGYVRVRAWIDPVRFTPVFEGLPVEAWIDSAVGEQITLDATIIGPEKLGSFLVAAETRGPAEVRGAFAADAIHGWSWHALFSLDAAVSLESVVPGSMTADACLSLAFALDAWLDYLPGSGSLTADATVLASPELVLAVDAVVADGAGSWWGFHLESAFSGTVVGDPPIEVNAQISGTPVHGFILSAWIPPRFRVDAFVQPYFTVNAYLGTTAIVVFPPAMEGTGGSPLGPNTFYAPDGDFDPSMVGGTIVIEGVGYVIVAVLNDHTLTVSPALPAGYGWDWYIPSGNATDPLGNPPVITREFRLVIEWSHPGDMTREAWHEITGDVVWAQTSFTQMAKTGAGTFDITMRGGFPVFTGGEEIRVSIDDFVIFGGYVLAVERGYFFPDAINEPRTVLHGADYNILLDRLILFNRVWDDAHHGTGEYRNWGSFPKGTMDDVIIKKVVSDYISHVPDFDFTTYIDPVDTPAPEVPVIWPPGTSLRQFLQEISKITRAVWWIDAYKNLHYHDRYEVTAPFPITDGEGGITCRDLRVTSDMTLMANDAFVWGTLAYTTAGEIMFAREPADSTSSVEYWERRIAALQPRIDAILLIKNVKRTPKQRANLASWVATMKVYIRELEKAQHAALHDLPQGAYGRWQRGEFRNDIHHQSWLARRAHAIFDRYSEPVWKAEATIFDPGFGAGMVANVTSTAYNMAAELIIREVRMSFVVGRAPHNGKYYAFPQYRLSLGVDPEDPWNIYDYLPFWFDDLPQRRFWPTNEDQEKKGLQWNVVDSFNVRSEDRTTTYTFGLADNDLDVPPSREWKTHDGSG